MFREKQKDCEGMSHTHCRDLNFGGYFCAVWIFFELISVHFGNSLTDFEHLWINFGHFWTTYIGWV